MAPRALALPLCLAALWLAPATHAVNVTQGLRGATKLPDFFPRCSIKDPKLKECIVVSANKVIPRIAEGYKPLNFPSLNPMVIDEIKMETNPGTSSLKLLAHNIVISGLGKTVMTDLILDAENQIYTASYSLPWLQIEADYEVDGKVLLLPIKGNGRANITFENSTFIYIQPFKMVKRKDGKVYQEFPQSHGVFNATRARIHLDNLFNGDKVLGEQINLFLNENWRDVMADFGTPFTDAAIGIIHQLLVAMSFKVPYDEVFLDVD